MRLYQMADAVRYGLMNTEELRETFLLEGMFEPGEIEFAYVDLDRTVIGSAVPVTETLGLETEGPFPRQVIDRDPDSLSAARIL